MSAPPRHGHIRTHFMLGSFKESKKIEIFLVGGVIGVVFTRNGKVIRYSFKHSTQRENKKTGAFPITFK